MKKILLTSVLILLAASCEKEYNIYLDDETSTVAKLLVEQNAPDESCQHGSTHIQQWIDDSLSLDLTYCNSAYFIMPETSSTSSWYLIHGDCDTLVNYFDRGESGFNSEEDSIIFKWALCSETIIIPNDTVYVHDTTEIIIYNTDTVTTVVHDTINTVTIVHDTTKETEVYAREKYLEEFCSGNYYFYKSINWIFGSCFYAEYCRLYSKNVYTDTTWTPVLFSEPLSVDSISISAGSRSNYNFELLLLDSSGNFYSLGIYNIQSNSFDYSDVSTYLQINYSVDLKNLEYRNMVRLGFVARTSSLPACPTQNDYLNIESIFVRGNKKIN